MDTKMEIEKTPKVVHRWGIVFGVLLILLGGLLIGANFGLTPDVKKVILSWQMLLIVIGIWSIFRQHLVSGLCLILVGGFFIIPKLAEVFPHTFPLVNEQFTSAYWSILLIGAGVLIVIYGVLAPRKKRHRRNRETGRLHHHCHRGRRPYEINSEFSGNVFSNCEIKN